MIRIRMHLLAKYAGTMWMNMVPVAGVSQAQQCKIHNIWTTQWTIYINHNIKTSKSLYTENTGL